MLTHGTALIFPIFDTAGRGRSFRRAPRCPHPARPLTNPEESSMTCDHLFTAASRQLSVARRSSPRYGGERPAQESGKTRNFSRNRWSLRTRAASHRRRTKVTTYATPARRTRIRRRPLPNHHRPDVRAVPDTGEQETEHASVIMVQRVHTYGACLESTPDGREGWAPYFVRQGISTYIVDQAGRGARGSTSPSS